MVSSLRIALAFVGCLSLVGCAAEPVTRSETPVEDSEEAPARSAPKGDEAEAEDDGDGTLPVTPVTTGDVTETEDRLPPAQGGEEPTKPGGTTGTPKPTVKTQTCTASKDGHSALISVTYTVQDGLANVSKLTMLVKNAKSNDQNDAFVFIKQSGGGEQKLLETKDILANGKTVEVDASKIAPKTGAVLRVEAHFDESFQADPKESCTINF